MISKNTFYVFILVTDMVKTSEFCKDLKNETEADFPFLKTQRKRNSYVVKVLYTTDGVGKNIGAIREFHSQRSNSLYQNTARVLTPRKKHRRGWRDALRPIQARALN